MWRGHRESLKEYYNAILTEWIKRGYKNTMTPQIIDYSSPEYQKPSWCGEPAFHASHRSNLLRKNPKHYGQFGWTEPSNLEYVWPVTIDTLRGTKTDATPKSRKRKNRKARVLEARQKILEERTEKGARPDSGGGPELNAGPVSGPSPSGPAV